MPMTKPHDPKDHPEHIPVEKRLSGDFGSPLELLAAGEIGPDQKREILRVWLRDLEAQPDSKETRDLRKSIREAMASLEQEVS
jgi:uncharacterized membrane protein